MKHVCLHVAMNKTDFLIFNTDFAIIQFNFGYFDICWISDKIKTIGKLSVFLLIIFQHKLPVSCCTRFFMTLTSVDFFTAFGSSILRPPEALILATAFSYIRKEINLDFSIISNKQFLLSFSNSRLKKIKQAIDCECELYIEIIETTHKNSTSSNRLHGCKI